jgi:hypothetical protein
VVQLGGGQVEQLRVARTKTTVQVDFLARGPLENNATALIFRDKQSLSVTYYRNLLTISTLLVTFDKNLDGFCDFLSVN